MDRENVPGEETPDPLTSELRVVLVVPDGYVVSDYVVFSAIKYFEMPAFVGLMSKLFRAVL